MKKISIVIPCLNEQEVIPIFYKKMTEIMEQMKEAAFELLFVDDGSTDNTLQLLRDLTKKDKRCRYLSFTRNFGKEAALLAGMEHSHGDYLAVMDVDLQDPPELLPVMYKELQNGIYDCVAARRVDRTGEKRIRSFFSSLFYKFQNKISKVPLVEGARDFRMMKRSMVQSVLQLKEYNRFSKGIYSWVGYNTKWSFGKLWKYFFDGILGFSTLPLSISSYGGILFCGISFLIICFLFLRYFLWHDPIQGWTTLMCAIFFIGGVQLLCAGISGQYLARMYMEVKQRPIYLVKESWTDEETKEDSCPDSHF